MFCVNLRFEGETHFLETLHFVEDKSVVLLWIRCNCYKKLSKKVAKIYNKFLQTYPRNIAIVPKTSVKEI